MMSTNAGREQAWQDTLSDDELVVVKRLADMSPSMAIAFVYVELKRLEKAPWWNGIGAGIGGGSAVGLVALVHSMGWLDKIIR